MRGIADESWTQPSSSAEERLFVRFDLHPVQNEDKSQREGRAIFDDVEFVSIMVPGDKQNQIHRPVRPTDKQRFAKQYAGWKAGEKEQISGTPLIEWPGITRSQVAEMAHLGVRSVEQLAGLSDANAQNFGPIMALRQKARDYVEQAKGNAPLAQMRAELEKRDNIIETLQRQMKDQADALAEMKRGKGK